MTRRQAVALLIVALVIWGGRFVRRQLLIGGDGQWRDSLLLDRALPPVPEPAPEPHTLHGPLDINHCPLDSLLLLPGVGPVLAGRILAERSAGGPFRNANDLQRVKGIGPHVGARLAPLIRCAPDSAPAGELHDVPTKNR